APPGGPPGRGLRGRGGQRGSGGGPHRGSAQPRPGGGERVHRAHLRGGGRPLGHGVGGGRRGGPAAAARRPLPGAGGGGGPRGAGGAGARGAAGRRRGPPP